MTREYVANGSRYKATISYSVSESDITSVDIDVRDVYQLPKSARCMSIKLQIAEDKQRTILRNGKVNNGKVSDTSTIITEEGTIVHSQKNEDTDSGDWMWKSNSINHRPRKFFVANASGEEIKVQLEDVNGKLSNDRIVRINWREIGTLGFNSEFDRVRITARGSEKVIFQGTAEPRTSIIVCFEDTVKITGKLYGEDIEAQKWIVDGRNYKPLTYMEYLEALDGKYRSLIIFFGDMIPGVRIISSFLKYIR